MEIKQSTNPASRHKRRLSKETAFCIISWVAVLLWMGLLFLLSSRPAELSNGDSGIITSAIVNLLDTLGIKGSINSEDVTLTVLVRKGAHFIGYLVLTLLILNALTATGRISKRFALPYAKLAMLAAAIAILYAMGDEVHQSFVPGRAMRFGDVLIDSAATFSATLLYFRFKRP